jgi:hypothetical protein
MEEDDDDDDDGGEFSSPSAEGKCFTLISITNYHNFSGCCHTS